MTTYKNHKNYEEIDIGRTNNSADGYDWCGARL